MKLIIVILIAILSHITVAFSGGRCSGSDPCSACTSCSGCKHCGKNGGTCGACKPKEIKPAKKVKFKKDTTAIDSIKPKR
ncbi:MAG TPA: hypothetical protein PLI74_11855 [Candidatus Kapabacteria bacterium]|nr:hypothetical protein [Candidatus Kapabacteria bacterium]